MLFKGRIRFQMLRSAVCRVNAFVDDMVDDDDDDDGDGIILAHKVEKAMKLLAGSF